MTILLTGASGFVGTAVAHRFLHGVPHRDQGSSRGRALGFRALIRDVRKAEARGIPPSCHVELDLTTATEADLRRALAGIEAIVHIAGLVRGSRADLDRVNTECTRRLAAAFEDVHPGGRFVLVSSLAAAGPSPDGVGTGREPELAGPVSDYGRSKLAGEIALRDVASSWISLRPGIVYGPWDTDVYVLFRMAERGVVPIVGRRSRYSLVYVDDVAEAVVLALDADESATGRAYPIAHAEVLAQDDMLRRMARAVGRDVRLLGLPRFMAYASAAAGEVASRLRGRPALFGFDKYREMKQGSWVCDPAPARERLGFEASVGHDDGFARTVQWYRDRGLLRRR
ncbi:MAG: NAD-dependent epimerase/dehydratase family protein [Planctomycetes bacterium]|nr:NAD-dependent epimerase/dehydratase family protein [Planctomycetota bacterium]